MRRRNLITCLTVAFATVLGTVGTGHVNAAGYWNMPGTLAQRTGHGYGGGYHAPWLLGPIKCDGCGWGAPVRLPCSPVPYYGCGSCGDYGRMVEAPSSIKSFVPTTAPVQEPMPATATPVETPMVEAASATASGDAPLEPEPIVEPAVEPAVEPVAEPLRPLFDAPVQP